MSLTSSCLCCCCVFGLAQALCCAPHLELCWLLLRWRPLPHSSVGCTQRLHVFRQQAGTALGSTWLFGAKHGPNGSRLWRSAAVWCACGVPEGRTLWSARFSGLTALCFAAVEAAGGPRDTHTERVQHGRARAHLHRPDGRRNRGCHLLPAGQGRHWYAPLPAFPCNPFSYSASWQATSQVPS